MPSTKTIEGATLAGYLGSKTDTAPNYTYTLTGQAPEGPELPTPPEKAPMLNSINPVSVAIGEPGFHLQCDGEGFTAGSVILWDGGVEPTTFVSANQLTTIIESTAVLPVGTVQIAVRNATGTSEALPLEVLPVAGRKVNHGRSG